MVCVLWEKNALLEYAGEEHAGLWESSIQWPTLVAVPH